MLLTACGASAPEVIRIPYEKIVIEKVKTPEALLVPCVRPNLDRLETTGDLEQALGEAIVSIEACNGDKERIKAWQDES